MAKYDISIYIVQEFLIQLFSDFPFVAPLLFIIIRATAIIIPPIPGILVDLPGIFVFGWLWGFIYAEIGIMLGATTAFLIGRKFREPLLKRFASLQKIHEWENKLSENQRFWTLVAIRLPTNLLFDYLSYAAGLTKISLFKFFFSTLIGNTPTVFLVFFFGGLIFRSRILYAIPLLATIVILWFVLRYRKISGGQ